MLLAILLLVVAAGFGHEAVGFGHEAAGFGHEDSGASARDLNSSRDELFLHSRRLEDSRGWTSPFSSFALAGVLTLFAALAFGCACLKSEKAKEEEASPVPYPRQSRVARRPSENLGESRLMGKKQQAVQRNSRLSSTTLPCVNMSRGFGKGKPTAKTVGKSAAVVGPNMTLAQATAERKQARNTRYGLAKSQHLGAWTTNTTHDEGMYSVEDDTVVGKAANANRKGDKGSTIAKGDMGNKGRKSIYQRGKSGDQGGKGGDQGGKGGDNSARPVVVADVSEVSTPVKPNVQLTVPDASPPSPAAPKMPNPIMTGTLNLQASPEWTKIMRNEGLDIATVMPLPPPVKAKAKAPPELNRIAAPVPKPSPVLTGGTLQIGQCDEWDEFLATRKMETGAMNALTKDGPRKLPEWLKDATNNGKNPTLNIEMDGTRDTTSTPRKGGVEKKTDTPSPSKASGERRLDPSSPSKHVGDRRLDTPSPGKMPVDKRHELIAGKRRKRRSPAPPRSPGSPGSPGPPGSPGSPGSPAPDSEEGSPTRLGLRGGTNNPSRQSGASRRDDVGEERTAKNEKRQPADGERPRKRPKDKRTMARWQQEQEERKSEIK